MKKLNILITLCLCLACIMPSGCKKDEPEPAPEHDNLIGDSFDRALPYQYPDWMGLLPDSLHLCQISIPGTHDTGADSHSGGIPAGMQWEVATQDFRFSNQLLLGIRWFDIRYCMVDHKLHHDLYILSRNLDDIISQSLAFLNDHPTETVILMIKQEYSRNLDYEFADEIAGIIGNYPKERFYLLNAIPTLGEIRNKIVITTHDVDNHNQHPLGANYGWPDNTTLHYGYTDNYYYYVQDHYSINYVDYDVKANEIRHLIDLSVQYPDPNRFDINFTSAEKNLRATSNKTVAHNLNGNIDAYLVEHCDWRHCGVIILNYAGGSDDGLCYADLARHVIQHNDFAFVKIGNQTWMSLNLHVTHYRNGDPIPEVTDPNTWKNLTSGAYCKYNNQEGGSYGYLYNWYAVTDQRGLAPIGWEVPTKSDWTNLIYFAGGAQHAGWVLKDVGKVHWWNNMGGDEVFWRAYPGGVRDVNGVYASLGECGFWWSATSASDNSKAYFYHMNFDNTAVDEIIDKKTLGMTVRCIKSTTE